MGWTISEEDLETWVCNNIRQVLGTDEATIVGRQVTLPSGRRLDLLVGAKIHGALRWIVVELKAVEAGPEAVTQLLGYVAEVHGMSAAFAISGDHDGALPEVMGILVAPTFSDKALWAVGGAPNLSCARARLSFRVEAPWRGVHGNHGDDANLMVSEWVDEVRYWGEMCDHFDRERGDLSLTSGNGKRDG